MNWTKVNLIELFDIEKYRQMGLFDFGQGIKMRNDCMAVKDFQDIQMIIEEMMYGSADNSVYMDVTDCLIIMCLFSRYISYDSIFKVLGEIKDSRSIYTKVKNCLKNEYFSKYKLKDDGEGTRYIYGLSEAGLARAISFVPKEKHPESIKRGRKKYKSKVHSYYCGYNLLQLMLTGFLEEYRIEYEMYNKPQDIVFRADSLAVIKGGCGRQFISIEQDTGTESPATLLDKIMNYYYADFLCQLHTCKLVYSFNSRCRDYFEKFFPFLFSDNYLKNVIKLMKFYQCDLDSLISMWKDSDSIRDNFNTICGYKGKKDSEARQATYLCANSVKKYCMLPNVMKVITQFKNDLKLEECVMKQRGYMVDCDAVQILLDACKIQCLNPFWHHLVKMRSYSEFIKRRNKVLQCVVEPLLDNSKDINDYHRVMLGASEVYLLPSDMLNAYFPILMPEQYEWQKKELAILKRYYPHLEYKGYRNQAFSCEQMNLKLWLRNAYEEKNREVYCEYAFASIASLFRIRFFLERYANLRLNDRQITVVCVVNGFNDAVNTALYLNYWRHINTEGDIAKIDRGGVDVVFCDYEDILNENFKTGLYRVWRYDDGRPAQDLASAELAGTGYGYAQPKGIYHNNEYGGCEGFYKIEIES